MMYSPLQWMKSIRDLDKHYSLYVDDDKKVYKIKEKHFGSY